jgi:surface protein
MAIRFLNTKYNRTLESLSNITYTEGANGLITAYVPFSATSFNEERSSAEVDVYGRQWCSIDGMQQYGLNENIYILRLRFWRNDIYDSFQTPERTAIVSGIFGTKNENMSFPFEFKITQIGCAASGMVEGDIVLWRLSGSTDTFSRIETADGWRGNSYGTRVIGSHEIIESKLKVSHCANLSGFYSGQNLLTRVITENCDFSNVIGFSNMFYNCQQLESVDVSDWSFDSATSLESMFSGCRALTSVTFPSITTKNCTNISSLFMNCTSITTVDVSGIDTENVTTMANMFSNCGSLETVDVSNFSTSKCVSMINMFNGCSSLEQIDIRNWNVSECTNFSGMFNRCNSLTNIIGGENEICGAMAMVGAKKSFNISSTDLDLPSIVAIFLGIARLEDGSNMYIRISQAQKESARDYLSVAQSKNWKIVVV